MPFLDSTGRADIFWLFTLLGCVQYAGKILQEVFDGRGIGMCLLDSETKYKIKILLVGRKPIRDSFVSTWFKEPPQIQYY
jgi:hypothetical protein